MTTARLRIAAVSPAGGRTDAARASDAALVRRIADADRLAVQALFARHHVGVYRFILRIVQDAALAEDLVSESFLYVWRQASQFGGRSAVTTWLLAIARYKALAALRRRRSEQAPDEETASRPVDPADDPDILARNWGGSAMLRKCLIALSEEHREVIDLVYYHGRSVKDVAEIVGIPEAAAKSRVFLARKRLGELLRAAGMDRAAA